VSTRCELEEVQCEDRAGLNTGNVAESTDELVAINLWVVDDQRTTALAVTASTELTLTSAELAGSLDLVNICGSTNGLEETESSGCACNGGAGEDLGFDDERDFWDGCDLVTTGHQESWDGRSSKGRNGCESPVQISYLNMRGNAGNAYF
jgi:hypothetical protein